MSEQIEPRERLEFDGTSPFTPHTAEDIEAMLQAIGATSVDELFEVPESIRFDGSLPIDSRSEQEVMASLTEQLGGNTELTEFLGRGHYEHYVPSLVDHLSARSEFLTSYTQYQPEMAQGFLQALFEYQSMIAELTGLKVANCSMYDAATALGEAARLADRIRSVEGTQVLVSDLVREEWLSVLENYLSGTDMTIRTYPTVDGVADPDLVADRITDETIMLYIENPTTIGTIQEDLAELGDLADRHDAVFSLGSDPVALSVLQEPANVGADIVVGDASALGLPNAYGMGLGLFACRDEYLRQVPGRLVGATEDAADRRAYTLTLQTREQHIREERATSNICTNQAWVALRTAIHIAALGTTGLVELADRCVELPRTLAAALTGIDGVSAPVHDRHHFREFLVETPDSADETAAALEDAGFAVHVVSDRRLQICVTEINEHETDEFIAAFAEVIN